MTACPPDALLSFSYILLCLSVMLSGDTRVEEVVAGAGC